MTTPEIKQNILHDKWVQERRHIANKRIRNTLIRATMALNSNYNNPSLRLFGGFRRFSWL